MWGLWFEAVCALVFVLGVWGGYLMLDAGSSDGSSDLVSEGRCSVLHGTCWMLGAGWFVLSAEC